VSRRPRIAVLPEGTRPWLADAVETGGGEIAAAEDAEGLVWTAVTDPGGLAASREKAPGIRWIQLPWAGIEPYAEAGVLDPSRTWTSGKGVYAKPVAEHALGLALAGLRDFKRFATARSWGEQAGISLVGGAATIFGAGGITEELVKLLARFDCRGRVGRRRAEELPGADRVLAFEERYEALKGADVVFLALALTPETRALIGEIELELMEPHAWLVNVARGEHVVTNELVTALRENAIGGAALDVTDPEPLPAEHPLLRAPNLLVLPHLGSATHATRERMADRAVDNLLAGLAGRPLPHEFPG
jgi:phosphoglycerate dehydrogenase-like enzyme